MSGFYKMDPAAWDFGTANLSLEEEAAYLRIVNAIHKHCAPVPDNDRVLAGLFRCSTRKARSLIRALENAGKLTITNGEIWNERARSDLVHRGFVSISRAESGAKGGRTTAARRAKALESNETPVALALPREEKRRVEKSPPTEGANAPSLRQVIFERGKRLFGGNAGGLINGWLRDFGEEATFGAITASEGKADPKAFAIGLLRRRARGEPDVALASHGIRDLDTGGPDDAGGNFSFDRRAPVAGTHGSDDLSDLFPHPRQEARQVPVREYVQ